MFKGLISIICVCFLGMIAWFIIGIFVQGLIDKVRSRNVPWHIANLPRKERKEWKRRNK